MLDDRLTHRGWQGGPAYMAMALATAVAGTAAAAQPAPATSTSSPTASSSSDDAGLGNDIVVTATRRAQSIGRVPLSIVAKDQVALDKQGVRSIADVARVTPSISFGQSSLYYGTGQSVISIRGVQSDSGIPTTGIYIDDTPIQTRTGVSPSLTNAYPQVFDLERLEVLRGPQGTLFGSGSVGGAIRFITPDPSYDDMHVYARGEVATTEKGASSYEAGVAVGAPIVRDELGFRASLWYRRDGGYLDRLDRYSQQVTQRDINDQESFSARIAVGWKASEGLTFTPSLFVQRMSIADGSRYELATSDPANQDFRTSLSIIPEDHHDTFYLPALKTNWELGDMTLVANTSYFTRKTDTQSDDSTLSLALFGGYSGPFPPGFETYVSGTKSHTRQKAFTQEIRLQNNNRDARFNWVVGLFFTDTKVRDAFNGSDPHILDVLDFGQGLIDEPPFASVEEAFGVGLYEGQYSVAQRNNSHDRQYAIFGQFDYEVAPRLKATVGLRYTYAKFNYDSFIAGPLYSTDGTIAHLSSKAQPITPKFGLSFQADRNNLFYANAAKGVRGSGVSPPVGNSCSVDAAAIGFDPNASRDVKPDTIWSYEVGSKNRFLGGKLTVDLAAYHVDWTEVQTLFALPICQLYTTLNLGKAKIDGIDFAVGAQPFRGLSVGASVSYIDARYASNIPGPNGTTIRKSGEPFAISPWTIQLNGEYAHALGGREYYGRADFTYSSHNGKAIDVASPLVDPNLPRPPATSQLNLRAGVRFDQIDLSLFANNVTNSHPVLSLYHDSLNSTRYRAGSFRPRTIGLTATIRR